MGGAWGLEQSLVFRVKGERHIVMNKIGLHRPLMQQGYGRPDHTASRKHARGWPVWVASALLLSGCQTVTVSARPGASARIDPVEDQLRAAGRELVLAATREGWAPDEGDSLANILLNGRQSGQDSGDALEGYLARIQASGSGATAQLERDVNGARVGAARLSDALEATLAKRALSQLELAEDLRLVERAIIYLKRGETLFSAAAARISSAHEDRAPGPPPAAGWELELLRAELKRLSEGVDGLAQRVMQQHSAPAPTKISPDDSP